MKDLFRKHGWPIVILFIFILLTYFLISTNYNYFLGDAGLFAKYAKTLFETNKIDTTGAAPALISQLLFSNIFCHIFGFSPKTLHLSVFIADFLLLLGMYFLLIELGASPFLSLIGALTLLINPVSIKLIDSYMTEPFLMFYLIFSLLFFTKGLNTDRYRYIYLGGGFAVLAVLTRQHAISLSVSLILLCLIYRRDLSKGVFYHSLICAVLPVAAIGLYYLNLFMGNRLQGAVHYAYAPENLAIIKSFINPLNLISRLYIDGLYFLHYAVLYTSPLFVILFLGFLKNPKRIKDSFVYFIISIVSILYVSSGTLFLYIRYNKLMPYIPSIFSIGFLTKIFNHAVITGKTASYILTAFTWTGAIILFIKICEHFGVSFFMRYPLNKGEKISENKKDNSRKGKFKDKARKLEKVQMGFAEKVQMDFGKRLIYFWGIAYLLVTIFVGLRYDRYILPFSVFIVCMVIINFSWIKKNRVSFIVVFLLFYTVFIYNIALHRLSLELEWRAGDYLLQQGIPAHEIGAGLGFNNFYSFNEINRMYKDFKVDRPINWQLFHPLARFFIKGTPGLEKKHPELLMYKSFSGKRWFGIIKRDSYIYKRKEGYRNFIFFF